MSEKKRLPVDVDFLSDLLHSGDAMFVWYLDSQTGDFLDEECCEIPEDPEAAGLIYIEPLPSWRGYNDMEDFIATVEDDALAARLSRAITGKGAFRRFKDVLYDYPEEQARWYKFRDARERERALEWLEDAGIEPVEPGDG